MDICTVETSEGAIMVPYEVVRSKRSRNLHLSLGEAKHAVLTVPRWATMGEAIEFLKKHGDWFSKNSAATRKSPSLLRFLQEQPSLSAFGENLAIDFGFNASKAAIRYCRTSNRVELRLESNSPFDPQLAYLLKRIAKEVVADRARELAGRHQISVERITIRDQRRCWGSCSDRKTLSLNWRLVLLSPDLHDYIIYHELAHLTHLNHSHSYWKLLRQYDPKAVRHDMKITRMAGSIMELGRG